MKKEDTSNLIKNNKKILFILLVYLIVLITAISFNPPFGLVVLLTIVKLDFILPVLVKLHLILIILFIALMFVLQRYYKKNKVIKWSYNSLFVIYLIISFLLFIFMIVFGNGSGFFE